MNRALDDLHATALALMGTLADLDAVVRGVAEVRCALGREDVEVLPATLRMRLDSDLARAYRRLAGKPRGY